MTNTYQERSQIFKELKSLFEFNESGILPPMILGMAGPIGIPIGYLDMTKVILDDKPLQGHLVIIWSDEEIGQIIINKNTLREATNEELQYALSHYKQAVKDFIKETILCFSQNEQEIPKFLKSRLGMIPYF